MGIGLLGMKLLIGLYLILAAVFLYERQWPYAAYWVFVSGLTACVVWIGK